MTGTVTRSTTKGNRAAACARAASPSPVPCSSATVRRFNVRARPSTVRPTDGIAGTPPIHHAYYDNVTVYNGRVTRIMGAD